MLETIFGLFMAFAVISTFLSLIWGWFWSSNSMYDQFLDLRRDSEIDGYGVRKVEIVHPICEKCGCTVFCEC